MELEELALNWQKTEDRSARNEGRIKKLEEEHKTLNSLATSVAVMAEQMKTMNTSVNTLTAKVDEIEARPGKRWEAIVAAAISAIVGALLGFVLAGMG